MVSPIVKQDRTTLNSFQRPFVKAKLDFAKSTGMDTFPYLDLLSKDGRKKLSAKFAEQFVVIKRVNSYLKAFFEMDRFLEHSPSLKTGPQASKRSRRKLPPPRKLPFSSVLYHVRFRGLPFFDAFVVRPFYSMPVVAVLEQNRLVLVLSDLLRARKPHLELKHVEFKLTKGLVQSHHLSGVKRILEYKFMHSPNACQILFKNNRSEILHFPSREVFQDFLKRLSHKRPWLKSKVPSCREDLKRQNLKSMWAFNNGLSNFSFLSYLNLLGSRSLDDFSQYPVFPLVISDAKEGRVQFRDLALPVGMIGDESKVTLLSEKYSKSDDFHDIPAYFYGSHYSSPATTFHFLLRMQPFVKGAKTIQNGRFDLPDRLFHSFENVLDNIQKETSDVREFPPELYYQPLFLVNLNNLDFGVNQSGVRVDHVLTPPVLGECPFRFVYALREHLESQRVSKTLSSWVDIIFGVHQKGESAVAKNNVFFYLTYQESERNLVEASAKDKEALETQVFHFGQVPLQLTQSPWPEKKTIDLSIVSSMYTKKYFVKKVFDEKVLGLTSTCEFCYEKIPVGSRSEYESVAKSRFCETCHLCRDCSVDPTRSDDAACHFCLEYEAKAHFYAESSGAAHENSILLIKEESYMDLNRKYVSKLSIVRPFRIDLYTFILFKSDKQVHEGVSLSQSQGFGAQTSASIDPTGSMPPDPSPEKSKKSASPFELNLNKSISLEKLQLEMKSWDLVGIPGGLWSIKHAFDLFKDKLFLGGCPRGLFRMFSTRKSKPQLTEKLHEYCICQVVVSSAGIILTRDLSGIIKISIVEDVHSKLQLKTLLCVSSMFEKHFRFLNFAAEQSQLFYFVTPSLEHFQVRVFDYLNNGKLLVDLDIPREKTPNQSEDAFAKLEFVDLSFGFLNAIVTVQHSPQSGQYFLSTCSFEGVGLTQFTLALGEENKLSGFQLFKDSFFKDFLVAISQKGRTRNAKATFTSLTCLSSKTSRRSPRR